MKTPKFIAIDPAYVDNATGFAYRTDSGSIYTGVFSSQKKHEIAGILGNARNIAQPCTHMIIEGAFLGKNPKTFARLIEAITKIKMVGEVHGYTIVDVAAATWQASMLTIGGHKPRERKEIKATSMWVAQKVYGCTLMDIGEHEADAVCMLGYSDSLGKQMEMAATAKANIGAIDVPEAEGR